MISSNLARPSLPRDADNTMTLKNSGDAHWTLSASKGLTIFLSLFALFKQNISNLRKNTTSRAGWGIRRTIGCGRWNEVQRGAATYLIYYLRKGESRLRDVSRLHVQ